MVKDIFDTMSWFMV